MESFEGVLQLYFWVDGSVNMGLIKSLETWITAAWTSANRRLRDLNEVQRDVRRKGDLARECFISDDYSNIERWC